MIPRTALKIAVDGDYQWLRHRERHRIRKVHSGCGEWDNKLKVLVKGYGDIPLQFAEDRSEDGQTP